jgi:hypothetical protein
MTKAPKLKPMFSLSPVVFRNSPIAGRGVFARKAFRPGEVIVAYAPKQRRVPMRSAEAVAAAETKLTLLSGEEVLIPDTSVPGGWLCNHSCNPNSALYASGEGRIQCMRPIDPGEEVTIFYGWVSHNQPGRDPCRCGAEGCRGTINFDLSDEDANCVELRDVMSPALPETGRSLERLVIAEPLRARLDEYRGFLKTIGQEQVEEAIAATLVRMKTRPQGSVVCAY